VNGQKGSEFRLQVKVGNAFYFLDGETSLNASISQEAVDNTSKPDSWRNLQSGCGLKTATVKSNGILRTGNPVSVFQELRRCALVGDPVQYQVHTGGGDDVTLFISGKGVVTSLERNGDKVGAELYSISIESADVVTFGGGETETVDDPTIVPNGGAFAPMFDLVTLSCTTSGAQIYYTLDGSVPTTSSILYSAPFMLGKGLIQVSCIAVKTGMEDSEVVTAIFASYTPVELATFDTYDEFSSGILYKTINHLFPTYTIS